MTGRNPVHPPKSAAWLLDRFSPVLENAPLAGDLMEAFNQGRSSGWYWRQVLVAIALGSVSFLRKRSGHLAYAGCCSAVITAGWWWMWSNGGLSSALPQLPALYKRGYFMQWPWSILYFMAFNVALVTAFQGTAVAVAVSVYFGLFRSLTLRNLTRALLGAITVLAGANAVLVFLSTLDVGLRIGPWWVLFSLITSIALVTGMLRADLRTGSLTQFSVSR